MRPTTVERSFSFPLSDQRLAEVAREMSTNLEEIKVLEENLAEAKEEAKAIPAKMKHIRELGVFIREGAEPRQVTCRIVYDDPEPGVKSFYRTDTNELVDSCEMEDSEAQGDLALDEKGRFTLPDRPGTPPPETPEKGRKGKKKNGVKGKVRRMTITAGGRTVIKSLYKKK